MNTPTYVLGLVAKLHKLKVEILQWKCRTFHGSGSARKKNGNLYSFILVHTMDLECWSNEIIVLQPRKQLMQFFGKLTKSWKQVYVMPHKTCHAGG